MKRPSGDTRRRARRAESCPSESRARHKAPNEPCLSVGLNAVRLLRGLRYDAAAPIGSIVRSSASFGRSCMGRAYNVIDADGHILEPFELWQQYTDPKYRDRAPRLVEDADGKRRLIVEERALGDQTRSFGSIGGIGARQGKVIATEMRYEE